MRHTEKVLSTHSPHRQTENSVRLCSILECRHFTDVLPAFSLAWRQSIVGVDCGWTCALPPRTLPCRFHFFTHNDCANSVGVFFYSSSPHINSNVFQVLTGGSRRTLIISVDEQLTCLGHVLWLGRLANRIIHTHTYQVERPADWRCSRPKGFTTEYIHEFITMEGKSSGRIEFDFSLPRKETNYRDPFVLSRSLIETSRWMLPS